MNLRPQNTGLRQVLLIDLYTGHVPNKYIPTLICPDSLRNGATYDDLASSKICVIFLTPGLSSCSLMPDRSAQRFFQNSISSSGPAFSEVCRASCALSTSLIWRVQCIMAAVQHLTHCNLTSLFVVWWKLVMRNTGHKTYACPRSRFEQFEFC